MAGDVASDSTTQSSANSSNVPSTIMPASTMEILSPFVRLCRNGSAFVIVVSFRDNQFYNLLLKPAGLLRLFARRKCSQDRLNRIFSQLAGYTVFGGFPKEFSVDEYPHNSTQNTHKLILHGVRETYLDVGIQQLISNKFSKFPKNSGGCREREDQHQQSCLIQWRRYFFFFQIV